MSIEDEIWAEVTRINSEGSLMDALRYEEIVGSARGVDRDTVMVVFRNLQEKGLEIGNPTSWVCNALCKERMSKGSKGEPREPKGEGKGGFGPPVFFNRPTVSTQSPEQEVINLVGWLNNEGGYNGAVDVKQVTEAAQDLDIAVVSQVLDNLQDKGYEVKDPTSWVCAALCKERRARGGSTGQSSSGTIKPVASVMAVDASNGWDLWEHVTWLNNECGFGGWLVYDEILEAATGLDDEVLQKVLSNILDKRDEVNDPTSWVCAALSKERRARTGKGDCKGGKAQAEPRLITPMMKAASFTWGAP